MGKSRVNFATLIQRAESRLTPAQIAMARLRFARYLAACAAHGVAGRAMGYRGHAYIEALEEAERGDSAEMMAGANQDRSHYEARDFSAHYDW